MVDLFFKIKRKILIVTGAEIYIMLFKKLALENALMLHNNKVSN
jgi:hypothetical protein